MKLIHTGDLHIGKTMSDFSLIPDQRFILDQLLAAAREEKADAFVIAGDVYDRAVPPGEAVQLLDSFLTSLLEEGIPVLLISGNHDSPERLGFGEEIRRRTGRFPGKHGWRNLQKATWMQKKKGNGLAWMFSLAGRPAFREPSSLFSACPRSGWPPIRKSGKRELRSSTVL